MKINRSRLLNLLGKDELRVERFIHDFHSCFSASVTNIIAAFQTQDWESASICCHNLKNQAQYLDLSELAILTRQLEQFADKQEMPEAQLLEQLGAIKKLIISQ